MKAGLVLLMSILVVITFAPTVNAQCPPVKSQGTLSEASWGETSIIYPTGDNLYEPNKWDQEKTCELLKARAGIELVSTRNTVVRKARPGNGDIEKILKPYHYVENFPSVDTEVSDNSVKWFYFSNDADKPEVHSWVPGTVRIKSYGPFYNVGGEDFHRKMYSYIKR